MNELKACPFCGKPKAQVINTPSGAIVSCANCHAQTTQYVRECDAIKRWNARMRSWKK